MEDNNTEDPPPSGSILVLFVLGVLVYSMGGDAAIFIFMFGGAALMFFGTIFEQKD